MVKIALSLDIERPFKKDGNLTPKDAEERLTVLDVLRQVNEIFDAYDAARTHFVLGGYLDQAVDALGQENIAALLRSENPRVEIAQETYSHPSIASLQTRPDIKTITPNQFREELQRARASIERHLGVTSTSLRMPYGFFQGLRNHPSYLQVVGEEGIKHVRADARSSDDLFDTGLFDGDSIRKPFTYPNRVIEVPINAPQDTAFTGESKTAGTEKYLMSASQILDLYKDTLDQAIAFSLRHNHDLTLSFDTHLHAIPKYDPSMTILPSLLEFCRSRNIEPVKYREIKP